MEKENKTKEEVYNTLPRVNQIALDNEKLRNEIKLLQYKIEESKEENEKALRYIQLLGCNQDFSRYKTEGGVPNLKLQPNQDLPSLSEEAIASIRTIQEDEDGYYQKIMLRAIYTLSGLIEETLPEHDLLTPREIKRRTDAYSVLSNLSRISEIIDNLSNK